MFVTHHLNEIPPEVDRVIVLKNGSIVADGDKDRVLDSDLLSDVYGVKLKITRAGDYYLASPA